MFGELQEYLGEGVVRGRALRAERGLTARTRWREDTQLEIFHRREQKVAEVVQRDA